MLDNDTGYFTCPKNGKNEKLLLDSIESKNSINILRGFRCGPFTLDGYCKETNTVYEVYEKYHYKSQKQIEKDMKRQKLIQDKLQCEFVIINDVSH